LYNSKLSHLFEGGFLFSTIERLKIASPVAATASISTGTIMIFCSKRIFGNGFEEVQRV
jgi:hypothetical protein